MQQQHERREQRGFDLAAIFLLTLGLALSIESRRRYNNGFPPAAVAQILFAPLVLLLCFVRPFPQKIYGLVERLRHPSRGTKAITAAALFGVSCVYLWSSALLHRRDLSPRIHDEFSYLIQAQLLARGRLWLPSPPL